MARPKEYQVLGPFSDSSTLADHLSEINVSAADGWEVVAVSEAPANFGTGTFGYNASLTILLER